MNSDDLVPMRPIHDVLSDDVSAREILDVFNQRAGQVIDHVNNKEENSNRRAMSRLTIDRFILIVFAICLLGALGVTLYLIVVNRLTAIGNVLYPLMSLVLGLMGGYFAGSGRAGRKS